MKVFRVVIFISILCVSISAQQPSTVTGRLKDLGQVISNQTVRLVSASESFETKTDADGVYRFDGVTDGKYLLVYGNKQASVRVKGGQLTAGELAEVVVVAANGAQTIEQVSKTVDVIDGQEMRDRADFSLIDSLRTIPGFRVQQLGGFGRLASIKTRGLRNQDTAILVDGIRFRDVTAITGDASAFLSDFTLTSVSKVEVLRGSGSSVYGTNAVGGTIDFQTPQTRKGTHGQVGGSFGGLGLGRFRGNISHGTAGGRFGLNAGMSRTAYTKGVDGQDNANNTNFQTRFDADPFSKTNISGRIFFSDADVRLNSGPDTFGIPPANNSSIISAQPNMNFVPDVNDPDNKQKSRFFSGQFVVNQVITRNLVIGGYFQRLKTKRTNDNGTLGAGFQSASTSIFDGTIRTGNAHVNWTPNGVNQFTAGYEFESEKYGNDGLTPSGTGNFFTRAGQKSNTFYVQDLVSVSDGRLQLAGSARVQKFSLDRPGFSLTNAPYNNLTLSDPPTAYTFDGAVSYFFRSSGTKLRAHVGNGYRVPSLYERFGSFFSSFGTPSFTAIGDPFLKPEKTIAFDGGVEQNLASNRVRLSATYFYTKLTDIIGYGNVVGNIGSSTRPFGGYVNQKGGIARGGEFSVKAKATSSTDIFASYTFTNSLQRTPQVTGNSNVKTLGIPDHQFTLVATQRFKRFWVNFDFLATSTYLAPIFSNTSFQTYVFRFKGNRKGDLTGGYTFGIKAEKLTLRLFGTIENIFDQEYYENGFRTAGATGRIGLSFGF
ncbi:MAG: TonB-dependent receptor [Pyrinomonadaceae bacterium]